MALYYAVYLCSDNSTSFLCLTATNSNVCLIRSKSPYIPFTLGKKSKIQFLKIPERFHCANYNSKYKIKIKKWNFLKLTSQKRFIYLS